LSAAEQSPSTGAPAPQSRRSRLNDRLVVARYKAGSGFAKALPGPLASIAAAGFGGVLTISMRDTRALVARHLQRIDPSLQGWALRRATQQAFDSYSRYYMETARLPSLSMATVERGFTVEGFEHIENALDAGHGVILALPHLGGWEWAGRWLGSRVKGVTVVVEAIQPPELFEWFADIRRDLGMNVVALGPSAGSQVIRALRNNEVVCLLSDRDITGGGIEVDFFGERTTLPAGPATIALRTGAPILPVAVYFTDRADGHLGMIRPPIPMDREGTLREDVTRLTQRLADELEVLIRSAPQQWHCFQPNWPSDPGYGE
jgi:KDO2-lipid IV(A) lauroyltransferase